MSEHHLPLLRAMCQDACAQLGEPPCYEVAPDVWRADAENPDRASCNCASATGVALAYLAKLIPAPSEGLGK